MTTPRVSVVMSVFDGARHLSRALESILSQPDVDLEYIVVDDGSSDASPDILRECAAKDCRVRVIHQENSGLTRALIRGCAEAEGRFIARQDADDVSLAGRLAEQATRLDADPSLGFVSCWAECIGPEDEPMFVTERPSDPDEATCGVLYAKMGPPAHGTVMFRRDLYERVGGYRPEFYYAQDSDLWHRMAQVSKIAYLQAVLYRYRFEVRSISGGKRHLQALYGDLGQACLAARLEGRDDSELLQQVASFPDTRTCGHQRSEADAAYFIGRCLLRRRDRRAGRYLVQAAMRAPWRVKAWCALAAHGVMAMRGA